jgi:hypothetical protein
MIAIFAVPTSPPDKSRVGNSAPHTVHAPAEGQL